METANLKSIITASLEHSVSYADYTDLVMQLVAEERTTGPKQNEDLIHYTKLNAQRSKRLNKTVEVNDHTSAVIQNIHQPMTWLVLTESWCGDAAQILPLLDKMSALNDQIDLRLVLRDENEALMDQFLTRGGRSIPKLIILNEDREVLGSWGPRPVAAQTLYDSWRDNPDKPPYKEFQVEMQKWYLKDAGESTFTEVTRILEDIQQVETV